MFHGDKRRNLQVENSHTYSFNYPSWKLVASNVLINNIAAIHFNSYGINASECARISFQTGLPNREKAAETDVVDTILWWWFLPITETHSWCKGTLG